MIGISVILGTITICYANVDVENKLMEIRTILNRQEKEITALRNENRVLRTDIKELAVESDNLKNTTSLKKKDSIKGNNFSTKLKTRISRAEVALKARIERPRNKRLSSTQARAIALYTYMSANEPNPSLHHALIFDAVKTNVGGGYNQFSGTFSTPTTGLHRRSWSNRFLHLCKS